MAWIDRNTQYDTDSTIIESFALIDTLKKSLEKYIIQEYIEKSPTGLNCVKIVDDDILTSCYCIPNSGGDLNHPITGKECPHPTNPWSERGVYASLYYPDVPFLIGDMNNDGVDDYILNYSIEGFGGGNMWINHNILILNNGDELQCVAEFQGNIKYSGARSVIESIDNQRVLTFFEKYDSDRNLLYTDTILQKYIEPFQVFESIKLSEAYILIDKILSIYENDLVSPEFYKEISSKGISLLTELNYCQRESGTVWNSLSDEFAVPLPVCEYSDSYTVHLLAPNYLVVQPKSVGTCGSGGCSIDVFSYTDGIFKKLDTSNFSTLLSSESTNEYLVETKTEMINGGVCRFSYKRKFQVIADTLNFFEIYDENHFVGNEAAHKKFCLNN